ncbi:cache domain-containing protein [Methanocorpusculum sp. MG]|uniref:Cache domain-containing protein n=1 Tax=Methanocorpusculum petauri TaxID=3002863 RepID=A0ABT4IGH5_9EURY|nr:cache domain-containing protein [Methanocorpusculum petauri]MCZ0860434.1 cache domain-containing protein [Methanocorpusculum petauri]
MSAILAVLLFCILCSGCILQPDSDLHVPEYSPLSDAPPEVLATLDNISRTILDQYNAVDADLADVALQLSGVPKDDVEELHGILLDMYSKYPISYGVCRIGPDGEEYSSIPYFSLSGFADDSEFWNFDEESFATDNETIMLQPVHSATYGVLLHFRHPVYTPDGKYDGYVGISFRPLWLYDQPAHFLMHANNSSWYPALFGHYGLILYQPNTEVIGVNLLDLTSQEGSDISKEMADIIQKPSGMLQYLNYPLSYHWTENHTVAWQEVSIGGKKVRAALISYEASPLPEDPDNKTGLQSSDLSSLVSQIYQYAHANSMDQTIATLNDPDGRFAIDTNITLFAYDQNGTVLANSKSTNSIGRNMLNVQGGYGLRYVSMMIDRSKQGGGFVHHYAVVGDPDSGTAMFTLSYLLPADGENSWFVGASYPMELVHPDVAIRYQLEDEVVAFHQYIQEQGKEAVLTSLQDPEITSQMTNSTLFALDYEGNILASPANVTWVGRNVFGFTDLHGTSSMREMIILAKQGGGYMLIEIENEDETHTMNLAYVEPIDDTWCIASVKQIDGDEK